MVITEDGLLSSKKNHNSKNTSLPILGGDFFIWKSSVNTYDYSIIFIYKNRKMSHNLTNKTILITWGSTGIGLALAHEFAQEGAKHLILTARTQEDLGKAQTDLEHEHPEVQVSIFSCDLSDQIARRKLYTDIKDQGIVVDILCNNAGFGKMIDFASGDIDLFQNMIDVNIKALVDLTHLFLQDMLVRGEWGIINTASVAGFQSLPYFNIYAATKAFVLSFTEALYGEYAEDGIRFLALCPAETNTNWLKRAGAKIQQSDDFDTPEEVAQAAIQAFKNDKMTVIPKWKSYFLHSIFMRLMPRKFLVKRIAKRYHYYKIKK